MGGAGEKTSGDRCSDNEGRLNRTLTLSWRERNAWRMLNERVILWFSGDPYPLQLIPTTMAAAAAATPGLGPLQLQVSRRDPLGTGEIQSKHSGFLYPSGNKSPNLKSEVTPVKPDLCGQSSKTTRS